MSKTLMDLLFIDFCNIILDTFFGGSSIISEFNFSFGEKNECFSHLFYTWHLIFSVHKLVGYNLLSSYKKQYSYSFFQMDF